MVDDLNERRPDPVDLILEGNFRGAIEKYSELYIRSLKEGDLYIGSDCCTQLLYAVAAKEEVPADQAVSKVRSLLERKIQTADLSYDIRQLDDDLRVAELAIIDARDRAERSIQAVEAQSSGWRENYNS